MAEVIVYAEIDDGVVHDISLQALTLARRLAGDGGKVVCVTAGAGVSGPAAGLFGHGADEVHAADDERLKHYVTRPFRRVLTGWLAGRQPAAVLFPASTVGDDLAPAVAAAMEAPCVLDADQVSAEGEAVAAKRAEYDRKVMSHYAPVTGGPVVVSLRDGAAEAPAADASRTGTVTPIEVVLDEADLVSKVLRRDVAAKTVNLKDAKIIVSAGAGVGSAEGLELVKQLASALGAEVGATRAVVDAGWLPADHQIGQTGTTVRPDVYIACGISGAVQHRVGMMDAGKIVAINIDANAPIFRIAHYKIVGDLKVVVPKLVKLLGA